MSEAKFPLTIATVMQGVEGAVAPGMIAGVWQARSPGLIEVFETGLRRKTPSEQPLSVATPFDLASLTKVMATTALAAVLVDRRWIRFETPLRAILPACPSDDIEIRHLLSHTAGFIAWRPFWEKLRVKAGATPLFQVPIEERQRWMRAEVMSVTPEAGPGERAVYSDLSFLLLGFALEEVTQMPLDLAVRKFVWEPMGLSGAFFRRVRCSVEEGRMESVAATEDCPWRGGVLQGQVHDDNCWSMGGYAGHAGAFGTIEDVLRFARALANGFISGKVMSQVWSRVSQPPGCERTLGWDTPSGPDSSAGHLFSARTVGHLGFTGTSLWIDLEKGVAVSLLTNRVHPSRENQKIRAFRPRFHDSVWSDLSKS